MSKIGLIIFCTCINLSLYSQNEVGIKGLDMSTLRLENPHFIRPMMFYSDSSTLNTFYYSYDNRIYSNNWGLSRYETLTGSYYKSLTYQNNNTYYSPFNQNVTYLGVGNINNVGIGIRQQLSKKLFLEGSFFLSKQDGYILHNNHITPYLDLKLNYSLTPNLSLNIWSKYVFRHNKDPFMSRLNLSPKSGVGIGAKYNPRSNVQFELKAGFQENIVKEEKAQFIIEGKTSIRF